jgi:hypothetical protein
MEIRMKNRFGKRFISDKELLGYAQDLDLFAGHPPSTLPEFLERSGVLMPVARIQFPPEVARRWNKDRYPSETVPDPIEGDTACLKAASELHNAIWFNQWTRADIYGERPHPLDKVPRAYKPFVRKKFRTKDFVPWANLRAVVAHRDGNAIHDSANSVRTCYHYWQVFALASFLRSGVTILYDLEDDALFEQLHRLRSPDKIDGKVRVTFNLEARHELNSIKRNAASFDAVAYFVAYRQNALQKHLPHRNPQSGKLPAASSRAYWRREREIARETLQRFALKPQQILDFIKFQCSLWSTATQRGPARVADEYRRNIDATIDVYRLTSRKPYSHVVAAVGRGMYHQPILKVMFPDWREEQRDLAERSLVHWIVPTLSALPPPFAVSESDITDFCDWIEKQGLIQLYWHFKRLEDLGFSDGPIARSALAAEVVSLANTAELVSNAILSERGRTVREIGGLADKVKAIVAPHSSRLAQLLDVWSRLAKTDSQKSLRHQLSVINRLKRGGALSPALRIFLKVRVIRNEGTHLGLNGFDRQGVYRLLEALIQGMTCCGRPGNVQADGTAY